MKRIIAPVLIAFLLVSPVAAQSTVACPEGYLCVEYRNESGSIDTLAIDPDDGYYQEIVVQEWITTIRDLDGEKTARGQVKLAGFIANGDSYELLGEHVENRVGIYANAQLRDTFGLTELK